MTGPMAGTDFSIELQFVAELLAATRAARVVWTGTVKPGCYQYIPGEYLLAIADDGDGPVLALHHRSGHRLQTLYPAMLLTPGGADMGPPFDELYALARSQALGLRRRLRQITKQIATAAAPVSQTDS